jgi:hypothetical protein
MNYGSLQLKGNTHTNNIWFTPPRKLTENALQGYKVKNLQKMSVFYEAEIGWTKYLFSKVLKDFSLKYMTEIVTCLM